MHMSNYFAVEVNLSMNDVSIKKSFASIDTMLIMNLILVIFCINVHCGYSFSHIYSATNYWQFTIALRMVLVFVYDYSQFDLPTFENLVSYKVCNPIVGFQVKSHDLCDGIILCDMYLAQKNLHVQRITVGYPIYCWIKSFHQFEFYNFEDGSTAG